MENKLKLTELAQYYIDRYGIETYGMENTSITLRQKIKRLLKKVIIGETNLYNAIDKQGEAREITIEEFEKHCFKDWVMFLVGDIPHGTKYVSHDNEALIADLERYNINLEEEKKWREIAKNENRAYNLYHKTQKFDDFYPENGDPCVTQDDVEKKGYAMMIEAIFNVFYEGFDWEKLRGDMEMSITLNTCYNADNPPEVFKAIDQLQDYNNYVLKRKE